MLQQHPLSAAFPAMQKMDFDALTMDIAENGLHLPITMFDGMVIDGWHRYRACLESGAEPRFEQLPDDVDPAAFVRSRNLHRRDLTPSQRAAAVVACCAWAKAGMNQHTDVGGEPGSPPIATVPQMAKDADVSERTIQQAKSAHTAGLGEQVRDGKLTAKKAAELARPPREDNNADVRKKSEQKQASKIPFAMRTGSDTTDAHYFKTLAISQLERIREDDPQRDAALRGVVTWIEKQLKGVRAMKLKSKGE